MKKIRIDDLSAIQQRQPGDDSFQETKKRSYVHCPREKKEVYYRCPICERLRAACPFTNIKTCSHGQNLLNPQIDVSMGSKNNNSTFIGERMKTYSTMESQFHSKNQPNVSQNHLSTGQLTRVQSKKLKTEIQGPQTQEIIFYPIIHNKIVNSPMPNKTPADTPTRRRNKNNSRYVNVRSDVVLTPTQFKNMMESYRYD